MVDRLSTNSLLISFLHFNLQQGLTNGQIASTLGVLTESEVVSTEKHIISDVQAVGVQYTRVTLKQLFKLTVRLDQFHVPLMHLLYTHAGITGEDR